MAKTPKLKVVKPKNFLLKPVSVDFKDLFKALAKGIGHTVAGKWEELGADAVESLSAIGLTTEPEELLFLLIRRSTTRAIFELIGEGASELLAEAKTDGDTLEERLDLSISLGGASIDSKFFDRPKDLDLVKELEILIGKWLEERGLEKPAARAISARFPTYFVYSLSQEWRKNGKSYAPLVEAINTPFMKAGEREWAWNSYTALLQRRVHENVFDEPFSLSQIFVPLNGYYTEEPTRKELAAETSLKERRDRRIVVSLQEELEQWLQRASREDTVRVISGGPGSGKSSFSRIFAARIAQDPKIKVLFIPLHLIDPSKDLVEEVGRFVRDEGVLMQNPLDPDSAESNLLIIFDGLDELASQGKAAAETARAFVREVERTAEKRNLQSLKLRVLIGGREVVVQENKSEFRRPRQILNLLPYFLNRTPGLDGNRFLENDEYVDTKKLLKDDLRQQWWRNYGKLNGQAYEGLPKELSRRDLDEITAQPLLNYLVALSLTRDKLDFKKDINLNSIYADLIAAVHERGYEKRRPYSPIRHMNSDDFFRVLEEIGLAAWHGDGRTTTVREIEEHCRTSGVGVLLEAFQDGAKAGVTRLLAAFFFRQHGQRASGDPTFVFTHKSFGEYLAARRIARATDRVVRESESRAKNPDQGWDERDALKHWAQICGPSAMSEFLFVFFLNEIKLRSVSELKIHQTRLAKLFGHMLRQGLPMEQLQLASFKDAMFQSRNAEESLLVALNSCATVTGDLSKVEYPDRVAFGAWVKRIQGQRNGPHSTLALRCLSFLDLGGISIDISDFWGANFSNSNLQGVLAHFATLAHADLRNANLRRCTLNHANLEGADLSGANLRQAHLVGASLQGARMPGADLRGAMIDGVDFRSVDTMNAIFDGGSPKAQIDISHKKRTTTKTKVEPN